MVCLDLHFFNDTNYRFRIQNRRDSAKTVHGGSIVMPRVETIIRLRPTSGFLGIDCGIQGSLQLHHKDLQIRVDYDFPVVGERLFEMHTSDTHLVKLKSKDNGTYGTDNPHNLFFTISPVRISKPEPINEDSKGRKRKEANKEEFRRAAVAGEGSKCKRQRREDPRHLPTEMSAISYHQLLDLDWQLRQKFGRQAETMSMYDVVKVHIEPLCREPRCSYAKWLNPSGLHLQAFVTHAWQENFRDFVRALVAMFRAHVHKPNLWICAFALYQGPPDVIASQLDLPIEKSPFVFALRDAQWFCVVRNNVVDIYSRGWCVVEIVTAMDLDLAPRKTLIGGPDTWKGSRFGAKDMKCSSRKDQSNILQFLQQKRSGRSVDDMIKKFRSFKALSD